jgi:hemolysin activation/secretion protein
LSGTLQHKNLNDDLGNNATSNQKTSNSIPLGVSFDSRDSFGGGGITFGSVMWTKGSLELNDALKANDTNTNTHGDFDKANLDLARMQAVQDKLALYVRGSAQWSNKNLDSSEGFGIGGISGVRAYPTGEGYGNVGWVTQTELRYTLNENFAPYAFYDVGSSTTNQTTVAANPIRDISGAGIGLRYTQDVWSSDISAAWRMNGGRPSDASTPDDAPRLWASVRYQM